MNRIIPIIIIFAMYSNSISAQQIPIFTQYQENIGVINPAALPTDFFTDEHNLSFGASIRKQWVDLPNSPFTQTLQGVHFNNSQGGVNLLTGGYLINDQTGPTGFTGAYGRLAGVISSDPKYSGLSIGLNAGMVQYRIKTSELHLKDPNDIVGTTDKTQIYPDLGMGAFYYQQLGGGLDGDYIYAGVSVPQIMGLDLSFLNGDGKFNLKRIQHYYAILGWYHFLGDKSSFLEPTVWIKSTPGVPINIDLNLRYQMTGSFWIGGGMTPFTKLHAEAGFIIGKNMGSDSNFRIGYSYDYAFASYGPYVGSTHEINLTFSLPTK